MILFPFFYFNFDFYNIFMFANFQWHPLRAKQGQNLDLGWIKHLEDIDAPRVFGSLKRLAKVMLYYLGLYRFKQLEEENAYAIVMVLGKILKICKSQEGKKSKWDNPYQLLKVFKKFGQYFPKILENDLQGIVSSFHPPLSYGKESKFQEEQFAYRSYRLLCCTQYFQKEVYLERELQTNNFLFLNDDFSLFSKQRSLRISQYICSVCNNGGGTLIFGFQKSETKFVATGISVRSFYGLTKLENFIKECKNIVKPSFQFILQRVPIKINNGKDSKMSGICLRAKISPLQRNKIYYLESFSSVQASAKSYNIYSFDEVQEPKKLYFEKNNLYELILKRFYYPQNKGSDFHHQKVKCSNSAYLDSSSEVFKENKVENFSGDIALNNKTLLIVQSQKQNRNVQNFMDYLVVKNVKFQVNRPFPDLLAYVQRSIWLLQHKLNFAGIKNMLINFEDQIVEKSSKITIMPVYKNIEIEQKKLSIKNQKMIEQQIKVCFEKPYKVEYCSIIDKNTGGEKNMVQFVFQSEAQSLFTYLICQSLYIRPYFTKNGNIFKTETEKIYKQNKWQK